MLTEEQHREAPVAPEKSRAGGVSVLIPVKNEKNNIVECLRSVCWADEIVVVDSGSSDGTAEIAASLGARVVQFTYRPGGLKKKNWALQNCSFRNDWILILDADERITPDLAKEINSAILNAGDCAGYYINRRFYFLDRWIRHAGYFPSWNLRLFRNGMGEYEFVPDHAAGTGDNEVHEHMIVRGSTRALTEPMDHYAYPDVYSFIEKHNRYSNWEACNVEAAQPLKGDCSADGINASINQRRTLKRLAQALPFPHWLRFFYHFFYRLGFLDGIAGYYFCHLLAEYQFQIWVKRREMHVAKDPYWKSPSVL
jgi:glycosyltransferase involved in cell wall biosynthesis